MISSILGSFSIDRGLLKVQNAWKKVHMGASGRRLEEFCLRWWQAIAHKHRNTKRRRCHFGLHVSPSWRGIVWRLSGCQVTGVVGFSFSPHTHLHVMTYASLWSKAVMSNTCLNRSLMWRIWAWLVAVGIKAETPRGQKQWVEIRRAQFDIYWNPHICFFHRETRILVALLTIFTQAVSPTLLRKLLCGKVSMKNGTLG